MGDYISIMLLVAVSEETYQMTHPENNLYYGETCAQIALGISE